MGRVSNGQLYWIGVTCGVLVLACCGHAWWRGSSFAGSKTLQFSVCQFDPANVDFSNTWILPGRPRDFLVNLRNLGTEDILIDEMLFSCSCASGAMADCRPFPARVSPNAIVPMRIRIVPDGKVMGLMRLRFGVLGSYGNRPIEPGGIAELFFALPVNAVPRAVSFGSVADAARPNTQQVRLWHASGATRPRNVTVRSEDPCVIAELRELDAETVQRSEFTRVDFAEVKITIDPKKAPDRLNADVIVASEAGEVRIPVLAFMTASPKETGAK